MTRSSGWVWAAAELTVNAMTVGRTTIRTARAICDLLGRLRAHLCLEITTGRRKANGQFQRDFDIRRNLR
jgi:hypothetical protein